jgi:hypothetical protein
VDDNKGGGANLGEPVYSPVLAPVFGNVCRLFALSAVLGLRTYWSVFNKRYWYLNFVGVE